KPRQTPWAVPGEGRPRSASTRRRQSSGRVEESPACRAWLVRAGWRPRVRSPMFHVKHPFSRGPARGAPARRYSPTRSGGVAAAVSPGEARNLAKLGVGAAQVQGTQPLGARLSFANPGSLWQTWARCEGPAPRKCKGNLPLGRKARFARTDTPNRIA